MIGHIEGTVRALRNTFAIVSTGGVGYKVALTKEALAGLKPERTVSLWTHLVVREDVLDLYGFRTEEELRIFELLLTVSGIGPKSALAVMDVASVETLRSAISQANANYLTEVSGIGKKTAGKIILELKVAKTICDEHIAQTLNYLKATGFKLALLINFGEEKLEYKRLIY